MARKQPFPAPESAQGCRLIPVMVVLESRMEAMLPFDEGQQRELVRNLVETTLQEAARAGRLDINESLCNRVLSVVCGRPLKGAGP